MQTTVVLDKCFLQGAPTKRVRELASSHRLVMSDALFYELLTGSEPGRSRCFAKLPQTDNPVELVNHIGTLLRIEIDTQRPAGRPSAHRENLKFQFHSGLMTGSYKLPLEVQDAVNEQLANLRVDVAAFAETASVMKSFFPGLLIGSQSQRVAARSAAEQEIVVPGSMIDFYESLKPPAGEKPLPPASLLDEQWALYRWLQVRFLFGIDLYVRYQGQVPKVFSPAVFERLEHDVLDAQILMLGCLEGSLATREKKLQRWWRLLCPIGELHV